MIVGLFAVACGAVGARIWTGAQPRELTMREAIREMQGGVNPEAATVRLGECMADAILALQNAALTDDRRGDLARAVLKELAKELSR